MNERKFVVMKEMEDEALSYEKGEEEETTHSVCTRQLQDDANRLKCKKNQQKKESRYLLMIRKTMKPTTAVTPSATMNGDWNQSSSLPLSSMICIAEIQITSKARPMVSIGNLRVGVSRWR